MRGTRLTGVAAAVLRRTHNLLTLLLLLLNVKANYLQTSASATLIFSSVEGPRNRTNVSICWTTLRTTSPRGSGGPAQETKLRFRKLPLSRLGFGSSWICCSASSPSALPSSAFTHPSSVRRLRAKGELGHEGQSGFMVQVGRKPAGPETVLVNLVPSGGQMLKVSR